MGRELARGFLCRVIDLDSQKWIQDADSETVEIVGIAGDHGEVVFVGGGRYQSVHLGKRSDSEKPTPTVCNAEGHGQDLISELLFDLSGPVSEVLRLCRVATAELFDSFANLAQSHHAQIQVRLMCGLEPFQDAGICSLFST